MTLVENMKLLAALVSVLLQTLVVKGQEKGVALDVQDKFVISCLLLNIISQLFFVVISEL